MATATLRCFAELNDFLPPDDRGQVFPISFRAPAPVRHVAESAGVPHTEIARVVHNGVPAGLEDPVADGDRLELHPWLEEPDGIPPPLAEEPRFVADAHLGKLAGYLRLLGFDTHHHNDLGDRVLAGLAEQEGRILLSRDRDLLMHRAVRQGCYLRPDDPQMQLRYLVRRLRLCDWIEPFSRCMVCNGTLSAVDKAAVIDQLPPAVAEHQQDFWRCDGCGRLYWQGSHWRALAARVEGLCGDQKG
jgi:uncharacterized protein with PIN domain